MDIYSHLIKPTIDIYDYINGENICFLDIETTGLSRRYNSIYLIGLIYFDKDADSWCLTQIFANTIDEETKILKKLNQLLYNFDLIVTYNGESFDLPFINFRLEKNNINSNILNINSLDIYRKVKKNSSYLQLENYKLKTVEENLGIYREDEYSGKDCIDFYNQYVRTKDELLKQRILKHNYDDLYYLLDIIKIFDVIKKFKSILITFKDKNVDIKIKDMNVNGDIFNISCDTTIADSHFNIVFYGESFNIDWQDNGLLKIDLEVKEGYITPTKKCVFISKRSLPSNVILEDSSQHMVPDDILLIKVENKYEIKNIKNIINQLSLYALNMA